MCMSSAAAAASPQSSQAADAGFQILRNIQGAETTLAANVNALMVSSENFAITLGKEAVIFLAIIGVLLYFSSLNRHLGKRLVEGGIVIGVFVAYVVPYLTAAYC